MVKMKFEVSLIGLIFLAILAPAASAALQNSKTCTTYFTGIGCPHCAKSDPVVLEEMVSEHSEFVVIEYEIYQLRENAPLLKDFNSKYNTGLGIPLIIFGKGNSIKGDRPIIKNIKTKIENLAGNKCPTSQGKKALKELNFNKLAGKPKIWTNERILIKQGSGKISEEILRELLTQKPEEVLGRVSSENVEPQPVPLSGSQVRFENAAKIDGWIFQWGFKEDTNSDGGNTGTSNGNSILILAVVIIIGVVIAWGIKR